MDNIFDLVLARHPDSRCGMKVLIEMKAYTQWQIDRALKARAAKPNRHYRKGRCQ